ncbi:GntR family transcriptional regulator [Clostridium formicaceticum]|nr:GntR family transcriptional regulator [Clostridium formicaceticum]
MKDEKGVTLYYKIKQYIEEKIDSGELKPGDQIPTEIELSKLFCVSRATVRQAISELVQDKKIVKKRGQGTFVAEQTLELEFIKLYFPEELGDFHELMSYSYEKPSNSLSEILNLASDEKVIKIYRIRYFNDKPTVLEKSFLRQDKFAEIEKQDLSQRIYKIIEDVYKIKLISSKTTIEPVIITAEEAELLKTTKGLPALLLSRTIYTYNNEPIIYTKSLLKGDTCKLLFCD